MSIDLVAKELEHVDLGDRRLNKRAIKIVEAMSANPEGSIPQIAGNASQAKATYRFLNSNRVDAQKILKAHLDKTKGRIKEHHTVLVVQDTTAVSYHKHPATKGLGHTSGSGGNGRFVHSALAVSLDGVPLGLIYQYSWVRDNETKAKRNTRREKQTDEKESQRWIDAQEHIQDRAGSRCRTITIADREADIYDLFKKARPKKNDLLIRGTHNRKTAESSYVWDSMMECDIACSMEVYIGRRDGNPGRYANLAVRFRPLEIMPPHQKKGAGVKLWAILAQEVDPPEGVEPVCWLLYTTIPLKSVDDAVNCVCWYSFRWLIERYHYVLKSGCNVEELQLRDNDSLERAFALYCIVAWYILWLTYLARIEPEASCEVALERAQWQVLYMMKHKQAPPQTPPTIADAVRWIASLGGWLGRKSDGFPGVKVLWTGFRRLEDMVAAYDTLLAVGYTSAPPKEVGNA